MDASGKIVVVGKLGMKKKRLLLLTVLAIALSASISLAFLRQEPLGPISEERAIAIIKANIAEAVQVRMYA